METVLVEVLSQCPAVVGLVLLWRISDRLDWRVTRLEEHDKRNGEQGSVLNKAVLDKLIELLEGKGGAE